MTNMWLLLSLLIALLAGPVLEGLIAGRMLVIASLTVLFLVGAFATRSTLRAFSLILLAAAIPAAWATVFTSSKPLFVAHCVLASVFCWIVGGAVIFLVVKRHVINLDSIFGAISAYLLFGLAWALSYWAIQTVSPDAFSFPVSRVSNGGPELPQIAAFSQFTYYSFVTMTTLGYGDITPVGRVTRTLAWTQCVTGQFYVAVVIAWLVSALPRPVSHTR